MDDRVDHCRAAMLGQGLGDAAGELAFAHPTRARLERAIDEAGGLTWTDDTAMARVLAHHLCRHPEVDPQALGDAFAAEYRRDPGRGYGPGPGRVFAEAARLGSYEAAARTLHGGEGSLGNGAAMRAAPVGLRFAADPGALDRNARAQARVTHAHPVAQDGAAIQARAVAEALNGHHRPVAWPSFLAALEEHARSDTMATALAHLRALLEAGAGVGEAVRILGTGVATHRSLPFALWCFLSHPDDWLAVFRCAALHGGDRDTLAAMAGAVAGARLGSTALPRWREKLEDAEGLAALGECLCRK